MLSGGCVCACSWNSFSYHNVSILLLVDLGLFPDWGCDKYYCYKHFCLHLLVNIWMYFCWYTEYLKIFSPPKNTLSFLHLELQSIWNYFFVYCVRKSRFIFFYMDIHSCLDIYHPGHLIISSSGVRIITSKELY